MEYVAGPSLADATFDRVPLPAIRSTKYATT